MLPHRCAGPARPSIRPIPPLPEGVEPLASHVEAPPELARRLKQIGVVARDDGARLVALLKPGQRLVSREGDLWRWDGFAAGAHAPTGAARRLAERSRLADIDGEINTARAEVEGKRRLVETAQSALAAAAAAEGSAREAWRAAQRDVGAAREDHATAEREIARNAARVSALKEAKARLAAGRDEAVAAREEALRALAALAPAADLDAQLVAVRSDIADKRARLAEVRAEAQALAREAELARAPPHDDRRRPRGLGRAQECAPPRSSRPSKPAPTEARGEQTELADAPQQFAEQRRALINEVEAAEEARRAAADRLAQAETALAEADRAVRAALEATRRGTRGTGARRGALRGRQAPPGGHRP